MIRQTLYSKENKHKNNSEHSANRALPLSGEPEGASGASFISHSLSLPLQSVSAVLTLLNEGCTIPFISRYRKERTGGLDEVQITDISELYDRLKELGKRKETILKTIREQEKLTPELEAKIRACMDSTELEDIYLPYKPKRRTRAQIAREQGLEPLALAIMRGASPNPSERRGEAPPDLPEGGGVPMRTRENKGTLNLPQHLSKVFANLSPLPSEGSEGALALDIIAEIVSENQQARNTVRTAYQRGAVITSKAIKKMKDTEEAQKFADYFDFSEPLRRCNSHRLLAMRRGEAQGFLRVSITIDSEECIARLTRQFVRGQGVCQTLVSQAVEDSFKRLINPSIENEFATLSKERADEEAIKVFTENLRQLLLSPPLGQKRVLALDPGFANGCKIACLDEQGNLLHHEIIYPHPPRNQVRQATEALQRMIRTYKIEAIAIGNGTASRESKEFVEKSLTPQPPLRRERGREAPSNSPEGGRVPMRTREDKGTLNLSQHLSEVSARLSPPLSGRSGGASSIFLVSEDGASIYSASPVAREEFPNEDVTTRGAISIGRRLMDPLAELVKIDPKSIGVGQYQHDVNQSKLKHSLDQIVMSCVNQVGVNLNTASLHLLTYVSGLGPALARNIIEYRREHGAFTSRAQLKKVKRLGDTAFQQCAGFLRIPDAKNPLDNSAVHPESYHIVEQMAKDLKCTIKDLIGNKKLLAEIDVKRYLTQNNQPHPPISLTPLTPSPSERGSEASPNPSEGRGVPMRTREDKGALNLPQHLSEVSASLSPPLSGRSGGALGATLRDILTELEKPGRDPRGEVEVFEFDKNVHTLNDLIVGMELHGIVTNITNFGAFVDIGVHQDGLVHISQLSDRFVTDPTQVVRLHQHVRVRVVEVDMRRKRIALSMKNIKQ
ncbi:Tex family protein [Prevotella melaninogenica]|uniref:Tex family protein n=1 Tax=Prevotella melaninogenica TaxID=28132 RepID=UPI001C5D36B7|nr:Tex family protein [Prevotella melaninogenica]MBW4728596.1 RNA-binding transcriptional accessory protein [Prevotella melaninogenica]MBW4731229.1 RNA-binding transcriptional accessory protein [Prevotella melaninogenica]MBW4749394.1 RNA-binding transcriptional accessory protein [Prevotella melaninogenica]